MREKSAAVKNAVKNFALLTLIVLLFALCAVNWLSALNIGQMPADNPLRQAYDRLAGGAIGYELRSSGIAAADPVQIALRSGDEPLQVAQYSFSELDAAFGVVQLPLGQMLAAAGDFGTATAQALRQALEKGDCLIVHYSGAVPLGVLAGWMSAPCESVLPAQTVIVSGAAQKLFVRTGDGSLYAADCRADSAVFASMAAALHGTQARLVGGAFRLYPETLLPEQEGLFCDALTAQPLDLLDAQEADASQPLLLGAFGYSAYTRSYWEQSGETAVYVDDMSTLRVARTGLVRYALSASGEGGVLAFDDGELIGVGALSAQVDCARTVLDTLQRAARADTRAALREVQQEDGLTTLLFEQQYDGVPVLESQPFAAFVFRGGTLISASVRLSRLHASAERQSVLPAVMAAVSSKGDSPAITVAYRQQEDGSYRAERFYRAS